MDFSPRTSQTAPRGSGFTLIELLVVMGIIVLLIGIITPAVKSLGAANRLTTAGNRVVNLMNLARQNSSSKNAMTALVLVTDPASVNRNRLFTMMELITPADGSVPTSSSWRQVGNWITLETGIIAEEPNSNALFDSYPGKLPTPAFPVLRYGAVTVTAYDYVIFMPNGVLLEANTPQLRLEEGVFPVGAASLVYTHPAVGNNALPANYYNIFVLNATGRVKIERK